MTTKFDVTKHVLVPKHQKISDKEQKELFEKFLIDLQNLPRIYRTDPSIAYLEVKEGDVVKITRHSPTAGETVFYRRMVA